MISIYHKHLKAHDNARTNNHNHKILMIKIESLFYLSAELSIFMLTC